MKNQSNRRVFLNQGAALGGGLLLLGSQVLNAEGKDGNSPAVKMAPSAENETLKTIAKLRTIHGNFKDEPLPEADLHTILEASIRAANASNCQSYSIIVVKDRKMMGDLCGYRGSCMLLYCADFNRMIASAKSLGLDYYPDTIENFVTATINTTLAAQTAVVAAKSLGVDSLLTNGIHRGDMDRLWKLLDLPETYCFPIIALVLGYPTLEPDHRTGRLDSAGVIHHEKYHLPVKEEVEEITREYDDQQRHLGLNDGWAAGGFKHYLEWYFKSWNSRSLKPADRETQMLRLLRRSGFIELQKS